MVGDWVDKARKALEDAERKLDFLRHRKKTYQQVFNGEGPAKDVLSDLARFCRANEPTYRDDAREHALLEGRREVWLRISNHLNLTSQQLYEIFNRPIGG